MNFWPDFFNIGIKSLLQLFSVLLSIHFSEFIFDSFWDNVDFSTDQSYFTRSTLDQLVQEKLEWLN